MVLNGLGVHRKCAGNVVNLSWNFKECFDDVRPLVKNKPKDPKDRDSEMVWDVMSIEYNIKNTLPFTPENTQRLYDMRNGTCNLVIKDESGTGDKPSYSIPKLESFKNSAFEELIEWASTPHTKVDRSYGDNLNNSHIG
jgi:hypothetical protein